MMGMLISLIKVIISSHIYIYIYYFFSPSLLHILLNVFIEFSMFTVEFVPCFDTFNRTQNYVHFLTSIIPSFFLRGILQPLKYPQ